MSRFNHYFANDFASCLLVGYARDHHRGRDVRIFKMPGDVENVGVTDGIDKWIAPVIANPFSINVIQWMKNHLDGVPNPKPVPPQAYTGRVRRSVMTAEDLPPRPGRRALITAEETPATTRSRRALLANV